jgi:uncharacterized protein YidB (DUF937 family)
MFEQLLNLVKENAGVAIINNPAIPNEQNEAAISHATTGILSGLKSQLASGNISDVMQLLNGHNNASANGVSDVISSNVSQGLMEKFGVSSGSASSIVSTLIPVVLSKLAIKTNDPNDNSFDLQSMFNHLSDGKTQGMDLKNILGSVMGSATDKSSGPGVLMDIFKK